MVTMYVATLLSLVGLAYCGNHTVTDEVWFEVEVKDMDGPGEDYNGRFTVALFGDSAPMTVLNFVSLAKGFKQQGTKKTLSYKGSKVHRIVQDFVIQMGDITTGDGTGGTSIYGPRFNDEDFILSHRSAGWLAMANHGKDTNGSQFYILLNKARWLDGKHVVFGKVIQGMNVIRTLGDVPANKDTAVPSKKIKIVDCGGEKLRDPYDIADNLLDSQEDL